jgi:malonate-semialdehyde dehydrogenase (acetylating)/methylmalonate-semialdehyde dehydrogenase
MWMFPIAIALGNCFIMKPSEKVPLTSQRMAALLVKAGLPAGVFSLLNGRAASSQALIDHPLVKAVAFVGSTPVARAVYQRATALGKRALCLGGAKNQIILAPDADPQLSVRGIIDSFTGCAGQRCMAASLLIAVGPVDSILQGIKAEASHIVLGKQMGAIIDSTSLEKMKAIIGRASMEGAEISLDGRAPKLPEGCEKGFWLGPTIIDKARTDMECTKVEIFGPVLSIIRVPTLSDALAIEAQNAFGNATSVFTTSGSVARHVATESKSGMIGVNIGVPVPREPFSFGGTKDSKFGACDITGPSVLEFWGQLKKITSKWSVQSDHNWMS